MTGAQFSFCQVQRDAGLVQNLFDLIFCICQLGQKNLRKSQRSDAAPVFRIYSAVRLPGIRFADMDTHSNVIFSVFLPYRYDLPESLDRTAYK